ncbi:MAG TPA: cytochrome C oxidase subunit II [Polyangia bacterium]|nr:cytochrome C oxidase subunit II [Polyangia bacterium]
MTARVVLPHDASLHGHLVDGVMRYIGVATAFWFVVMVVVLLVASIFHRAGRAQALYTHGDSRRHYLLAALVAAAIFVGIDMVTLVRSAGDLRRVFWNFPADADSLRVEVTAQQWAWTFRYAGADGRFNTPDDIVTLNDLHVPVDRPVTLKLRSKDVVHSFYLPNFRAKIDAVPGNETRLWFQARETGKFEIGCAQHCGVSHYKMRGELTVDSPDDYQRWAENAAADSALRYDPVEAGLYDGWDWGT